MFGSIYFADEMWVKVNILFEERSNFVSMLIMSLSWRMIIMLTSVVTFELASRCNCTNDATLTIQIEFYSSRLVFHTMDVLNNQPENFQTLNRGIFLRHNSNKFGCRS